MEKMFVKNEEQEPYIVEGIKEQNHWIEDLRTELKKVIVGQEYMIDRILIGLLTGGHILLEGVPGLAKSLTSSTLAKAVNLDFQRIQFTPDLLPADILGTEVYHQKTGDFQIKKGAIFSDFILADEVNRAPAKVQSALLEAMEEKQVSIGEQTYKLGNTFFVIATQNPLEQQGTYPLPEAQQDRFMMKLKIQYPSREEEKEILERYTIASDQDEVVPIIKKDDIIKLREDINNVYVDEHIKNYVLDIVLATRKETPYLTFGASPRATLNLIKGAKGMAYINNRDYVMPDDVKAIAYDVLRHRIGLSYEAEAEEMTAETIIEEILEQIKLP